MKEIRDIAHAYEEAQKQGLRAALATVVSIKGSSYRRPGARMLITEDGKLTGAISGGCLDGHVQRKALLVITQNKPTLVTYDSLGEDETGGARLGCNGIIRIFIEPVIAGDPYHPVHLLNQVINQRQKAVLATIFSAANSPVPAATSLLYHENGCIAGNMPDALIGNALVKDCENVFTSKAPAIISYTFNENASVKAYIDYIAPPVSIVIVGAGNDAIPAGLGGHDSGWKSKLCHARPLPGRAKSNLHKTR
jgi:xanthine dehydrogenase accessory factor